MGIQPFFRIRKALSFKLLLEPSTDELQDDAEEEDEEEEEEEDISPLGETTLSRSGPICRSLFVSPFPFSSGRSRFRQPVPVLVRPFPFFVRPFPFSSGRSRFCQAVPVLVRPFPFLSLAVFPVVTKNKVLRC
ncbi:hypothetical protein DPMN_061712 [Dreissena polymorpha]|uniref:Uncharacterized protein n=1 Tax=Dreissena polymorpha TaxID=45954 RepID=A0A9D4C7H8_DREPO|nr:hypothetical protein DPMN_061712 [Dreissena polymorpha]